MTLALPHKAIIDRCAPEIGPLMIRYFILRTPLLGIYIHRFLRSDNDRHVHDHPWSFWTLLFHRGYWEHLPDGSRVWRRRWSLLFRPAEWQHWVEISEPVWTLVVRLRKKRDWGFITQVGWIDHGTYDSGWCGEQVS